jgi:hypothetical protein
LKERIASDLHGLENKDKDFTTEENRVAQRKDFFRVRDERRKDDN